MQRLDSVFTEMMKSSLVGNQPYLVSNLTNVAGIMDYLVAGRVFPDPEDVMCHNNRKDQVRNLLRRLVTRPAQHYWTFVACLYEDRIGQGNIAETILSTYEQQGGAIPPGVSTLRQDYLDRHRQHDNILPVVPPPPDPAVHPHHQRLPAGQAPPRQFDLPAPSAPVQPRPPAPEGDGRRTETGNFLTSDSQSMGAQQPHPPESMETDAGDGRQQNVSLPFSRPIAVVGSDEESVYCKTRRTDPQKVYKMDSNPRGLALIIENENFDYLTTRTDTESDRQQLEDLLRNILGFEVTMKRDLRAREMLKALAEFSQHSQMGDVDSCIVAILSHGSAGGVIFGVDGKVEDSRPKAGTFILTTEMRNFFCSANARLSGKPKLFILQACRGEMEDRAEGVVPIHRDVVESPPAVRTESVYLDMSFVYATLADMIAYRHTFIPPLVQVFRENAATLCFKDMMTELHGVVGTTRIGDQLYVSSEYSSNLRKKWYFNPPSNSA